MRILIVVHGFPPTHAGGAELRAARTALAFAGRDHSVRVLCIESVHAPPGHPPYEDRDQDGVLVRRLFLQREQSEAQLAWHDDNPQTAQALKEIIATWHPEVVHLFSGYLMTGSIIRTANEHSVPVVVSLTDFWWLCHRINLLRTDGSRCTGPTPEGCARCRSEVYRRFRLPARVWRAASDSFWRQSGRSSTLGRLLNVPYHAERLQASVAVLNQADALIAPSQCLADIYTRYGVEQAKVRVWRQGVDIDQCIVPAASPVLRVGYLGQVKPHKGVDLLVDAWAMLRGSRPRSLVICGSDKGEAKYGQRLRQQMAQLHDARWEGAFQPGAVWRTLADLDVIVVPSRWIENSPNVILEAQAVGVVVVGTDLGGVAELLRHEQNGLLFEPDNAADLAAQLQRLLDEPDLLARLRRHQVPFLRFTDEIERIEALYTSLCETPIAQVGSADGAPPRSDARLSV